MKYEKSCGVILFRKEESPLFLLLQYGAGHWGFSKGHMEEGESENETALRELQEETGISDVKILPGFREKINYTYKAAGVIRNKTVIFLLASTSEDEITLSHEHKDFIWLPYEETLEKITYSDEKKMFSLVEKYMNAHDSTLDEYF